MNLAIRFVRQVFALFVDDGSLAIAILIVVALAAISTSALGLPPAVAGGALLTGCILALLENVLRAARRR
jgi:hypothetical protein